MTQYIDYYSKGYEDKVDADLDIDVLREAGAEAVTEPFQIVSIVDTLENDENGLPIFGTLTDGQWYFNVRSSKPLTGNWIGPEPETPSRVWA